MLSLGIDLAAQDRNTAYCTIEWSAGSAEISVPVVGVSDPQLLTLMNAADWTAVDAPFGWPDDFVEAVHGYATSGSWPQGAQSARLRHRETDRVVHDVVAERAGNKLWPLSVSSDRIAVCAWRCAALLAAHAARSNSSLNRVGLPADCVPVPGELVAPAGIVEVYPAAALALWGMPFKGYKGSTASAAVERDRRADILAALERTAAWLIITVPVREACVLNDDCLDALIAGVVARAAATGRTLEPSRDQLAAAHREGWIHLPLRKAIVDLAVSCE